MGGSHAMDPEKTTLAAERSPLASHYDRIAASYALSEGPIRFLLVSGDRDDGTWGLIGAFWLSIDGTRGGFLVSPEAIWQGSEMVRSFKGAMKRGWTAETIYRY
ncbi:MAG TPA: hypothetical protein VK646_08090, partial [Actinomycetota bacterium]|nr:hypothetical protein [Actinomycetota bacterium]